MFLFLSPLGTLQFAHAEDDDGDGYTVADGDCNDANPTINPGATDLPNNGLDEDCNRQDALKRKKLLLNLKKKKNPFLIG